MSGIRMIRAAAAMLAVFSMAGVRAASAEELRVYAAGDELIVEAGPYSLPAGAGHDPAAHAPPLAAVVPADVWVHGYRIEIVDDRGEVLPQRLLHHFNLIVPQRRELFSNIMQRLAAAGGETAPVSLPRVLGYRLAAGDSLLLLGMLHNPTAESYEGVRMRVRLRTTAPRRGLRAAIQPFYLDVMPPAGGHAFDLPPGRSEHSWEGSPAAAGRVLGMGGHLHRYGVSLKLEDVTRGRVIWQGKPQLDADGNVVGMPKKMYLWRFGLPLRTDRVYRLTAVYDNPTGRTIALGGMGALGGIVVPARRARWPRLARDHADYVTDIQTLFVGAYTRDPSEHVHHH